MMMSGKARVLTSASWNGFDLEREARDRVAGRGADREARDDRQRSDVDAPQERLLDAVRVEEDVHRLHREVAGDEVLRVLVDGVEARERGDRDQVDGREDERRDRDRRQVGERPADRMRGSAISAASARAASAA